MVAASLTEARLHWGTPDCGRHGKKGVSGVVTTVEGDAFHVRTELASADPAQTLSRDSTGPPDIGSCNSQRRSELLVRSPPLANHPVLVDILQGLSPV
ncbi:hypothetical protein NDU88_010302 [Pleurodeles waltl]|uniref:Uncharacterized protein n=1 Tax=Pleurodeles waltl TaxID=8319 RepID=A0AAV7S0W1_PLEWA|nr:hypothetical protein NDU88_010302 [Pleurodeles waltl]